MITGKLSNFMGSEQELQLREYIRNADEDIKNLFLVTQGRVSFGDGSGGASENVAGEFQVVADTGVADTEFSVTHTLGVAPVGFLVTNIDAGGVVYDSGTAWTSTTAYFKCSAANAAVTLFLLK